MPGFDLSNLGRALREETAALLTETRAAVRRSVALRACVADERAKRGAAGRDSPRTRAPRPSVRADR